MNAPGAWLQRVALLGPGLEDWDQATAVLRGTRDYAAARTHIPAVVPLPASDRRRAGRVVRLALGVAAVAAGDDAKSLATVFASSGGDGENCDALCTALAQPAREISPIRFMNSVHNAAAGYWGIGLGVHAAATALCAHDGSAAAGLLDALTQLDPHTPAVMLVAYDADYPEPLRAARPIPDAFAVALVMTRERGTNPLRASPLRPRRSARFPRLPEVRSKTCAARFPPRGCCRCSPWSRTARAARWCSNTSTSCHSPSP